MAEKTEFSLNELTINKLSYRQYKKALENRELNENEFYSFPVENPYRTNSYDDLSSYTQSSNQYTCDSDGYLFVESGSTAGIVYINNIMNVSVVNNTTCTFIRKGMKLYCSSSNIPSKARFYPLV